MKASCTWKNWIHCARHWLDWTSGCIWKFDLQLQVVKVINSDQYKEPGCAVWINFNLLYPNSSILEYCFAEYRWELKYCSNIIDIVFLRHIFSDIFKFDVTRYYLSIQQECSKLFCVLIWNDNYLIKQLDSLNFCSIVESLNSTVC